MRLLWYVVLVVMVVVLAIGWGQTTSAQSGCDPAYPDFCIAPPPPDLDCRDKEVGGRHNFRVLPPDPHHFDGEDDDGIGCELPPQ